MNRNRPATLKEIALRAGVGPAAASVVLNGAKSGTRVSDETRDAILRAAQELNYRPNALARSLRTKRTGIVGYFSGYECIDPRNQYIAEILSGIQNGAAKRGMDILLYTPQSGHTPEEIVGNLQNGRLDGLILTGLPGHPLAHLLTESYLPAVAIADPIPGLPSVVADNEMGSRLQARHLFERGHRRVLYRPSVFPFPSTLDRWRWFKDEADVLGIQVIVGAPVNGHDHWTERIRREDWDLIPADAAHLEGPDRCTAIVCWDDVPAYRTASYLERRGLRVPEDVAVIGFNGIDPGVEPRWRLTTIQANWPHVGETAFEVLNQALEGMTPPAQTITPVRLEVGETT